VHPLGVDVVRARKPIDRRLGRIEKSIDGIALGLSFDVPACRFEMLAASSRFGLGDMPPW
jgi:hypothetical protein